MTMNEKLLFSIIGILLGWLLKELSSNMKDSKDYRYRLGRALACLNYLNTEMLMLQGQYDNFKSMLDDPKNYEKYRQYVTKRYPRNDDKFYSKLGESIDVVAEKFPLFAVEIDRVVQSYIFLKSMKLSSISEIDNNFYIKMLSAMEVGHEVYQGQLEKILKRIAFSHSLFTALKFKSSLNKLKKNRESCSSLSENSFNELKEILARKANKANAADAKSRAAD